MTTLKPGVVFCFDASQLHLTKASDQNNVIALRQTYFFKQLITLFMVHPLFLQYVYYCLPIIEHILARLTSSSNQISDVHDLLVTHYESKLFY